VVVQNHVVISPAGACGSTTGSTPEPLFIRGLAGGAWHVLRWLPGTEPPILAADGDLLAIGVQRSLTAMDVTILDVRTGSTSASFRLSDGYLAFAGAGRLVL
jgi:hypothetical protein